MDTIRHCYIARGSLDETIHHTLVARDLRYCADVEFQECYDLAYQARRTLNGYIGYIWRKRQGHELYHHTPIGKAIKEELTQYGIEDIEKEMSGVVNE